MALTDIPAPRKFTRPGDIPTTKGASVNIQTEHLGITNVLTRHPEKTTDEDTTKMTARVLFAFLDTEEASAKRPRSIQAHSFSLIWDITSVLQWLTFWKVLLNHSPSIKYIEPRSSPGLQSSFTTCLCTMGLQRALHLPHWLFYFSLFRSLLPLG